MADVMTLIAELNRDFLVPRAKCRKCAGDIVHELIAMYDKSSATFDKLHAEMMKKPVPPKCTADQVFMVALCTIRNFNSLTSFY